MYSETINNELDLIKDELFSVSESSKHILYIKIYLIIIITFIKSTKA